MKKLLIWTGAAAVLMLICPWLTVTFAGISGMAICFLLFYGVNPLFCAVCGVVAGQNIRRLWPLPILSPALFLAGVWLFFEMGEPDFLLYAACYLGLGTVCMLASAVVARIKS